MSRNLNHLNDPLRNFICFVYCHINKRKSQEFSDHPWEGDLLIKCGRYFPPLRINMSLVFPRSSLLFLQFIKPLGMPWVWPEGGGIIIRFTFLWKARWAWLGQEWASQVPTTVWIGIQADRPQDSTGCPHG